MYLEQWGVNPPYNSRNLHFEVMDILLFLGAQTLTLIMYTLYISKNTENLHQYFTEFFTAGKK